MEDDIKFTQVEEDLKFFSNGRQPQVFQKEDDLNISIGRSLNDILVNEIEPQFHSYRRQSLCS
jgi:hypothetical protein